MSFGGSRSNSTSLSANQAYDYLKGSYGGSVSAGTGATNALSGLLGTGGDPAASQAAFSNYLGSSGYKFQLGEGVGAINTNNASRGLLNSGSALKKVQSYGQGLAGNYLQQYMSQLGALSGQGAAAGNLIGQTGQYSRSKSDGTQANFGFG